MTGATAGFTVAYILPSTFYLKVHKNNDARRRNAQIALFIALFLAVCCTTSLLT